MRGPVAQFFSLVSVGEAREVLDTASAPSQRSHVPDAASAGYADAWHPHDDGRRIHHKANCAGEFIPPSGNSSGRGFCVWGPIRS
jgi:hypothetical protein